MEFPPELTQIIREYAKPAFVNWKVFNEAKQVVDPRHWTPLRKALCGPNAGLLVEELQKYLKVIPLRKSCETTLRTFEHSVGIYREWGCWCQESQRVVQWNPHTDKVEPLPVLTEEQEQTKYLWGSRSINLRIQESSLLDEVLYQVYGREWVESDEE